MKPGWKEFSELCDRWKMNEYTVAKFVIDGELWSYTKGYMKIWIQEKGYLVSTPDDVPEVSNKRLTVAEVKELIFFSSDVEEFEKKKGITPHVRLIDVGDPTATVTPQDSTTNKEGPDKACAPSEKDSEGFIRSLQVSYVDYTEVKIQYKGKPMNYTCQSIGFRDSKTKEWKTFLEILESKDHVYRLGPAHSIDKAIHQKVRRKEYDKRIKTLPKINEKFISFLTQHYNINFPPKFKLYERLPTEGDGAYSFKFQIPSVQPSYNTKEQALNRLEMLSQKGASDDAISQAVQKAMEAGATKDEVLEILQDRLPSQP
jgi:alkylhydroperoxidase/carboxymuconolactone decarboxylase family protein YurZ